MRYRQLWVFTAFGFSSVINPGYFAGCASSTDDENAPDYKAITAEMEQQVLAANDSYDLTIDNVAYRLDVDIEPARAAAAHARSADSPFAQTAHACGTHKLVSTAQACADTYEMDVTGSVTLLRALGEDTYEEVASGVAVTGALSSYGTLSLRFDGGRVGLQRQGSDDFKLGSYVLQSLTEH